MNNTGFIITGVSSGLGFALAQEALSLGSYVFGCSRHEPNKVGSEDAFLWQQIDLSQEFDSSDLIQNAFTFFDSKKVERIILINNAGTVEPMAHGGDYPSKAVTQALMLNVNGPILLSNAFLAQMPSDKEGVILTISSGAAHTAYPGWGIYCATKAAVDQFSRVLAKEQTKIKIVALAPGVVDTDMQKNIRQTNDKDFPMVDRFIQLKDKGQLSTAKDTAKAILNYLGHPSFGEETVVDIRNITNE